MSELPDFGLQCFRTDAERIFFPGGIDVRQNDPVRDRKRSGECGKERFGPGIGMRLEDAPDRFMGIIFGCI